MKLLFRLSLLLIAQILFLSACSTNTKHQFENRWTYVSRSLRTDDDCNDIRDIVKTAAESGLNGILLSAGFRKNRFEDPEYVRRLSVVKNICEEENIEIIPIFLSAGYGHGLEENPNLAAGLPVRDALFVVNGDRASLFTDHDARVVNGSFESLDDGQMSGYQSPELLGEVIRSDSSVFREGKRSLRFEDFTAYPRETGQLTQTIPLIPYRSYTISCWLKTEGMDPPRPFSLGHIRFEVRGVPDGRRLQFLDPQIPTDTDWRLVQVGFNSMNYQKVELSIGAATGDGGRFWIDDLQIKEVGLVSALRRPGTPLTVRGERNGTVYEEGKDFLRIIDPALNHRLDHDGPEIRLTPDSRMTNGERLRVSWYHSLSLFRGQVSVCMSEPELFDIFQQTIQLVSDHLSPRKFFLSMDEVRAGGSCSACKAAGKSMGEILGQCITRQVQMIQEIKPGAEVLTWSDMLDPTHNSGRRFYYLVDGNFDYSWEHVPEDLIMAIWGRKVRIESFEHFSGLGFRTLGAAYYDSDELEDIPGWIEVLKRTPGATGIMYTTWLNKYDLLPKFGDVINAD